MLDWAFASMGHRLEFAAAWLVLKILGLLPRSAARACGAGLARILYLFTPGLRSIADQNLRMAMPEMPAAERKRVIRGVYRSLGRLLAECAQFPRLNAGNVSETVEYEGLNHYQQAVARKRGVLFLTAHLGAWELGAFAHAVNGYPLHVVYRPLDNPLLDAFVNRYRTLSGNKLIDKRESVRPMLAALSRNETIGILADQNTLLEEGVFVDFFRVRASTTAGIARIALRTGAQVVPAFCVWVPEAKRFRIIFRPALELRSTGTTEIDIVTATQQMTAVIEEYVQKYPDQWLWIHRRWKTRPPGDPRIYG